MQLHMKARKDGQAQPKLSEHRPNAGVGLKRKATKLLKPLMDSGLVTGMTVEKGGGSSPAWITVAVSIQTKASAPDYDAAECENIIQRLKSALGDLPFRTVTRQAF